MLSQKIKRIIEENRPYLEALEEYDRTGKLRKVSYKERLDITIDENVLKALREYCKDKNIKVSNFIESLIKKELKL